MQRATRFFLAFVFIASACTANYSPVDIEDGDMCAFCKMAISERQYAAEVIFEDEAVKKFDDIGCMLKYQKMNGGGELPAAVYVAHSRTKAWLKAEEAVFVRSETAKTPMGSGIIAFSSPDEAGTATLRYSELGEK